MAEIITITDPTDPRIAAYADIRERDLVGRKGLFVAEGEVVLRVLVEASNCQAVSLLVAEKRLAGLAPLLAKLPEAVPVLAVRQEIMNLIVGFPMHRGILALGRKPAAALPEALLAGLGKRAVVVVLFAIANHDNMGGIFRNAAAFGAGAVLLDSNCCDPLYRKAIRVSVGAALTVPFARLAAGEDCLPLLASHGFTAIALSPQGQIGLADVRRSDRMALLLGAEGEGLPAEVLARARTVSIPMAAGFDSLNVATASGIALHHLAFAAGG